MTNRKLWTQEVLPPTFRKTPSYSPSYDSMGPISGLLLPQK